MGLSICRSIIEFHGGRIWVNSTVGVGTQFLFAIPLTRLGHDE
jgi:signal transduction histidine kinase